jgi:chromosome segregation ATPase
MEYEFISKRAYTSMVESYERQFAKMRDNHKQVVARVVAREQAKQKARNYADAVYGNARTAAFVFDQDYKAKYLAAKCDLDEANETLERYDHGKRLLALENDICTLDELCTERARTITSLQAELRKAVDKCDDNLTHGQEIACLTAALNHQASTITNLEALLTDARTEVTEVSRFINGTKKYRVVSRVERRRH